VARIPRRYEAKGAPRSRLEELALTLAALRAEVSLLKEKVEQAAPRPT
jgi:hypothetical protein